MTLKRRGFTLIVVAVIMVMITAVVVGVVASLRGERISAVRQREEARARAIAEGCADRMFALATTYIRQSQATTSEPPPDFDGLLDPDGRRNSGDEFVPGGGGIVFVPPAARAAANRHALFRMEGGACLVRFEDNSDDWHPGLGDKGTSNTGGVIEGPDAGDEVVDRDRDRSVWVSVIGVFPAMDGVPDEELWARAHARVPIRRFLETAGGPAIWAGDEVTMANSGVAVCGLGGIVSASIERPDDVCACGHQKHDDHDNAIGNECDYTRSAGDACDDRTRACEPNLRVEAPQPDPGPSELPRELGFRSLNRPDELQDACALWLRDPDARDPAGSSPSASFRDETGRGLTSVDGLVYLYVDDDARRRARDTNIFRELIGALAGSGLCGTSLGATDPSCGGVAEPAGCPAVRNDPLPPPCRWTDADGEMLEQPVCRTGDMGQESRCWIPIAQLDGKPQLMTSAEGIVDAISGELGEILDGAPIPLLLRPIVEPLLAGASRGLALEVAGSVIGIGEFSTFVVRGTDTPCDPDARTDCEEVLALQRQNSAITAALPPVAGTTISLSLSAGGLRLRASTPLGPLELSFGLGDLDDAITDLVGPDPALALERLCGGGCTGTDACVNDIAFRVVKSTAGVSQWTTGSALKDKREVPRAVIYLVENAGNRPERDRLLVDLGIPGSTADRHAMTPLRTAFRASGDIEFSAPAALCCPTCVCPHEGAGVVDELPRRIPHPAPAARAAGLDCDVHALSRWVTPDRDSLRNVIAADGGCSLHGGSIVLGTVRCGDLTMLATPGDERDRTGGGCFVGGLDGRPLCGDRPCAARSDPHLIDDCTGRSGDDPRVTGVDVRVPDCNDDGLCIPHSVGVVGNVRSATDVCIGPNVTVYGQIVALDDIAIARGLVVNHDNAGSLGAVTQAQAWFEGLP